MGIYTTCANYLNLFIFSTSYDWSPRSGTLCLTNEQLGQISQHFHPILRRWRWSHINYVRMSVCNDYVFETHSEINPTVATRTQPLISNQMSYQLQRYLTLVNINRTFHMREHISQLSKPLNLCTSSDYYEARRKFDFEAIQSVLYNNSHFGRCKMHPRHTVSSKLSKNA